MEATEQELQELNFKRLNDYRQQIFIKFDLDELAGLRTFTYAFHTRDGHDGTKYNGWNFTIREWDYFWNNETTTMLFGTNTYTLGTNTVDLISVRVQPERIVMIDQEVTNTILGFPVDYKDVVVNTVSLLASTD